MYGKLCPGEIVLPRKIVRFRLAILSDTRGEFLVLVKVMRNRPEIVKELAEQVPAAVALNDICAEKLVARGLDSLFEQRSLALKFYIAESFVFRSQRPVSGFRCGGEPALVDSAAIRAERIQISRIQFQASARHKKGARHPTGGEPHHAVAGGQGVKNQVFVRHGEDSAFSNSSMVSGIAGAGAMAA